MNTVRRISLILAFSAAFFVFSSHDASAQRVIDGQSVVNVQVSPLTQMGATMGWSRCGYLGQVVLSANLLYDDAVKYLSDSEIAQAGGSSLRPCDMFASGGYMFRIASTRSRGLMLYGGATLDAGYRAYAFKLYEQTEEVGEDGFRTVTPTSEDPYLKGHFIYGITPEIGLQMFLAKKTSVSLFAKPRMRFNRMATEPWFVPSCGVGLHFYL